jgi:hypothetical protein
MSIQRKISRLIKLRRETIGGNKRMETQEIFLTFEIEAGANGHILAQEVQARLMTLQAVSRAEADVESPRLVGAEVVAGIAVGVVVVRGVRKLAQELNLLIPEIARMVREIKGLRAAFVEVDGENVPIDEMDESRIATLTSG